MNDDGYLLLAVADDFLEEFGGDVLFDLDAAYDWLIRKAHEIGTEDPS